MPDPTPLSAGTIAWHDLTVSNADQVRDFYSQVVGWRPEPLCMGDYDDYCMNHPETGETVAGICHSRGANIKLPPQWLMYIRVADLDVAVKRCTELGGNVVDGPRGQSPDRFCAIRDPAGACVVLVGE
jgi:predicted enzyme related to lactoylglutathione lyase